MKKSQSPLFFFTQKLMILLTLGLASRALIAEPTDKPIDDACLSDELAEAQKQPSLTGKEAYQKVCATCHMVDGIGSPGVFPPLKGSEWTQNSMVIANIILRGLSGTIQVSGVQYASSMSSFANELTDQEIVALVEYIQTEFNGTDASITEKDVATIRAKNLRRISSQSGLIALQEQYN
jgi:mono/diheme cytochrome c family protein